MKRVIVFLILFGFLAPCISLVWSHNPFISKPEEQHQAPKPVFKSQFFVKIILWQHQLKQKMSELIRVVHKEDNVKTLISLMGLAFIYGSIHAAGPGHGKFVATSYVLSHKASIMSGLFFALSFAIFHGFSGAIAVLSLHYIIQWSISETLITVTTVTQIVSFSLIVFLGVGMLLKNGYILFFESSPKHKITEAKVSKKNLLAWAIAVGFVPCPSVVMVMLFCLSMDVMVLGLLLAACISLGMAMTIFFVVTAIIIGKSGILNKISKEYIKKIEGIVGIFAGTAIILFGLLFLLATINSAIY